MPEFTAKELLKRRKAAVKIAYKYAQTDGAHHKLWVIDQIVRKLLGPVEYKVFVKNYQAKQGSVWDFGVAP
jgi:hypothetical protein